MDIEHEDEEDFAKVYMNSTKAFNFLLSALLISIKL